MSDRTTINVSKDAHKAAEPLKEENDHSWSDVLEWYAEHADADSGPLTREELEDILNQISMANEPTTELDTGEIIGRLEDLRAELPKEVAKEVHQR